MSEAGRFTIELEQLRDYQINDKFDWPGAADVLMDEPPPLGAQARDPMPRACWLRPPATALAVVQK